MSNNVQPGANFRVLHLDAGTWYNLRITAHNSAGFTVGEYEFATLTANGGICKFINPLRVTNESKDTNSKIWIHGGSLEMQIRKSNTTALIKHYVAFAFADASYSTKQCMRLSHEKYFFFLLESVQCPHPIVEVPFGSIDASSSKPVCWKSQGLPCIDETPVESTVPQWTDSHTEWLDTNDLII